MIAADKGEKKKSDLKKIQGKWTVVESYRKGKKSDDAMGTVFTFSGKNAISVPKGGGKITVAVFELRPEKTPQELDLRIEKITWKCIYSLSGDTLEICYAPLDNMRPDAIGTAAGDERELIVLKRVKGDAKKKP